MTGPQRWMLKRAGYKDTELEGKTKHEASRLIDFTQSLGGLRPCARKEAQMLDDSYRVDDPDLPAMDEELFGASQIKIRNEEELSIILKRGIDDKAEGGGDYWGRLKELGKNDEKHAKEKVVVLAWYRKNIKHGYWEEFCKAIGLARSTADKLARIGQTLADTPQNIMEELCNRGYNPMRHRDQWIFKAATIGYAKLLPQTPQADKAPETEGAIFATVAKIDEGSDPSNRHVAAQVAVTRAEATRKASVLPNAQKTRKTALRVVLEQQYGNLNPEEYAIENEIMEVVQNFLEEKIGMESLMPVSLYRFRKLSKGVKALPREDAPAIA